MTHLVWYEPYDRIVEAIDREKALNKWRRGWKIRLINHSGVRVHAGTPPHVADAAVLNSELASGAPE